MGEEGDHFSLHVPSTLAGCSPLVVRSAVRCIDTTTSEED